MDDHSFDLRRPKPPTLRKSSKLAKPARPILIESDKQTMNMLYLFSLRSSRTLCGRPGHSLRRSGFASTRGASAPQVLRLRNSRDCRKTALAAELRFARTGLQNPRRGNGGKRMDRRQVLGGIGAGALSV
jgi:hypothetical protein